MFLCVCFHQDRGSRRQSVETLDIPIKKPSVDKLEAIEQNRRSSMQQRRASLVELIPDWPTLQHREVKKEVSHMYNAALTTYGTLL